MWAEFIIKTVSRDPCRVAANFRMFFHAEERVTGSCTQSETISKEATGGHTVDFKARVSMEFRHWPWRVFIEGPPVRAAPSDYEMFCIL